MLEMRSPLDGFRSPFGIGHNGGPSYPADAAAYFAAMTTQESSEMKDLVVTLIAGLQTDDVWPYVDWLGLGPMATEQAARVNLKTPAQVATIGGSPTHTARQGYAGDNTAAYLDSGVLGSTLTDTDTSLFARVRTNGSVLKSIAGYRNGRHVLQQGGASKSNSRLITNTVTSVSLTNSGSGQFICASRTGTTSTHQVNTTIEDTDTVVTDAALNNQTIRFLADSASFSDAQLSAWGFGKHLDITRATALRSHLETFITAAEAL